MENLKNNINKLDNKNIRNAAQYNRIINILFKCTWNIYQRGP